MLPVCEACRISTGVSRRAVEGGAAPGSWRGTEVTFGTEGGVSEDFGLGLGKAAFPPVSFFATKPPVTDLGFDGGVRLSSTQEVLSLATEFGMFLHLLNPPQKEAFFALALEFVEIDGDFSLSERERLEQSFAETKLPFSLSSIEKATPLTRPALLAPFSSQQAKVCLLLEMIGLGYVDGKFCDREETYVDQMTVALGLHAAEVMQLKDWVKRFFLLYQETAFFW